MSEAPAPENPPAEARQLTARLGPIVLRGWQAGVFLLAVLAIVIRSIVRNKPWIDPSPMWIAAAFWAWFEIYWTLKASGATAARSSESRASRAVHTRLFMASILLYFLSVPGLNGHVLPSARWVVPAGAVIQASALWFAIRARKTLGKHWSGELTVKEGHEIVMSGPYRVLRHPIYTGILGMGLGTAVISNSWHAFIGFAVMSFAYWRKIRMEERWLLDHFGSAYAEYRAKTWSLVPLIF